MNTEARSTQLVAAIATVYADAVRADVKLDEGPEFIMPPAASKLTTKAAYVKLLVQQRVLGSMVGDQQQVPLPATVTMILGFYEDFYLVVGMFSVEYHLISLFPRVSFTIISSDM